MPTIPFIVLYIKNTVTNNNIYFSKYLTSEKVKSKYKTQNENEYIQFINLN